MSTILDLLPSALRAVRERRGLSYAAVAREAGVTPPTIRIAEGGRLGNVDTLGRHMAALGMELRWVRVRVRRGWG